MSGTQFWHHRVTVLLCFVPAPITGPCKDWVFNYSDDCVEIMEGVGRGQKLDSCPGEKLTGTISEAPLSSIVRDFRHSAKHWLTIRMNDR